MRFVSAFIDKLKSFSLKSKLFIALLLLSLIPTLLVSIVSQNLIIRSTTNDTAALSSQIVKYIANDINANLLSIEESLNTFVIDSEFQKFIAVPSSDFPSQARYAINFRPLLQLLDQSKEEVLNILYLDQHQKVYSESQEVFLNLDYPFFQDPFYKQVMNMTTVELSTIHTQAYDVLENRQVVSFIKPVYEFSKSKITAWILVEMDVEWLYNIMNQTKFGDNSYALLYQPNRNEVMTNMADGNLIASLKPKLQEHIEKEDQFTFDFNGISYQVTYATIPLANWYFVGVIPLEEMMKGVRQSQITTFLVAFGSLLIALFIAYPVMGIVLKPLYLLKRGMTLLGHGTSIQIQHSSSDEFGFLIRTYNQMLEDLEQLRQEVLKTKLREKEKELLQLQAQVNPHFLFNTLETIESYSLHHDGDAVSDMLQSVSGILRYNVRNDGGKAPLYQEIDYIRNFLSIHYYRTERQINAVFDIDPNLLHVSVMKLSIQPFVENALKYGWNGAIDEEFQLTVSVQHQGKQIEIKIIDNGQGIADETFMILNSLTNSDGDLSQSDHPFFKKHTGIANVYRRYFLVYGEDFSMKFDRLVHDTRSNRGTIVQIRIPNL